jgi:hypothetical protein
MPGTTIIGLTPIAPPSAPAGSGVHASRITYQDAIDRLIDYLGAPGSPEAVREARRAILAAYRELPTRHRWTYLLVHGRTFTNGQYTTGTVQYFHSAGAFPRQLTLTGGTWPSWAVFGSIRIGTVTYDVVNRVDANNLQLDPVINPGPGGDVAIPAGTPYTLYRDTYTLPADFIAADRGFAEISWGAMEYVHVSSWIQVVRYYLSSSNTPRYYTFTGDPRNPGFLALRIFPFPDIDRTLDFVYHKMPRALAIPNYSVGKASVALGQPTTITGSGTTWTSSMVGSVVRLSTNAQPPTGLDGANPYSDERTIVAVPSPTTLTVDAAFTTAYTAAPYVVSDPIDWDSNSSILDCFFRCCEKYICSQRIMKNKPDAEQSFLTALIIAKENDSRSMAGRVAGPAGPYKQRLARMPSGPDVS